MQIEDWRVEGDRHAGSIAAIVAERGPLTVAAFMELALYHPDGKKFVTPDELFASAEHAKTEAAIATAAAKRAKAAAKTAKAEAAVERQAKERLQAKLRELGIDPESL